jgi:tetratricopeptide (TPR) repeat protein
MRALELAPNHAKAHEALGRIYIHTNRAARGIAEVERAIALDRNLAPAYADIGVAKIMLGRAEDTEDYIVRCFRLSPRDTFAHIWCFRAGVAKLYLGREDEAVAWLRRAIEANRTYSLAHLGLAAALALQGQTAGAQAAAEAGRTLNPGFTIRRYRDGALSDNVTYLAQRERIAAVLRNVGIPEL